MTLQTHSAALATPCGRPLHSQVPRTRLLSRWSLLASSFLLMGLGAGMPWWNGAYAKDVPNAKSPPSANASDPQSLRLKKVIITAEKRRQNIQNVPVSITAITGNEFQLQGITGITAAAQEVPGVAIQSFGPGQTQITIRGLSSQNGPVSTIGFYIDGAPMSSPAGSQNGHVFVSPAFYDIDRVEVLRGPQGTLYGSGSMGGTIRIITNKPQLTTFAASVKADTSNTSGGGQNWNGDAMLNIPVIKGKLAIRLVGTDLHNSGWINRVVLSDFPPPTNPLPQCAPFAGCTRGNVLAAPVSAVHHGVNSEDLRSGRISLRYRPTSRLLLDAEYMTQRISQDGLSSFDSPPGPRYEAHYQPFDVPEPFYDTFHMENLRVEYRLPEFTVTSVSSYWSRAQFQTQDVSEAMQSAFDMPSFATASGGLGPQLANELDGTRQFSQEIRLSSAGNGRFQWLIGGFYSNYHYGQHQFDGGAGLIPLFGSSNLFMQRSSTTLIQTSGFANMSYKVGRHFKVTAGVRRFAYAQSNHSVVSGIVTGSLSPQLMYLPEARDSGFAPSFTLSYDVNHDLLVYATAGKGYRPGEQNPPVPVTGPQSCLSSLEAIGITHAPAQTNPDTVWSYEVGEKSTLFNGRVVLNADAYDERWTNVQQLVGLQCGFGFLGNVGTAAVHGGEFELKARLSPAWTLTQTGAFTHAYLTSTVLGTGLVSGEPLLNVPRYSAATSLVFTHPFSKYTLVGSASNVVQASSQALEYSLTKLPFYDIVRARIGLVRNAWSVYIFCNNLTNRVAYLGDTHDYALDIPSLTRFATNQPRTVGISFQYFYR